MTSKAKFDSVPFTRFVDIVQEKGEGENADTPYLKFTRNDIKEHLTFKEMYHLVNKTANLFKSELEDIALVNEAGYLAVGYLSQSNQNCLINHFGLMSLNATPVILSPRNSVDILVHLLKQSQSKALVYGKEMEGVALQCQRELRYLKLIPKFEPKQKNSNLTEKPQPLLHIRDNEADTQVAIVLHSSGSTAFPKLIKISNQYISTFLKRFRDNIGFELYFGSQLLLSPLFHIFGLFLSWLFLNNNSSVALSSSQALHPKQIIQDVEYYRPSLVVLLPYLIKQLGEYCEIHQEPWEALNKVSGLLFGGAILPIDIANLMKQNHVTLINSYGSTETGFVAASGPKSHYLNLHIATALQYELVNIEKDTCQIKVLAKDPALAIDVADSEGFVIGDQIKIINHNILSNHFEFRVLGRVDDIIIHISGEKTNPLPMEEIITSCPLVKSAIVVGSGKLNTSLLIQLNEAEASNYPVMKIPNIIYSYIGKVNKLCPSHSRIDLDLVYILPLHPDKPLPCTAKGNVNRKLANSNFNSEIELLYAKYNMTSLST